GIGSELLVDFDKSQIDQLIRTHPELGVRAIHTGKYIPKIALAIDSIQDFASKTEAGIDKDADIFDESLLTPEVEKAPPGYKNVTRIAEELEIDGSTLKKIVDDLNELGELTPIKAKPVGGGSVFDIYSPEDITSMKEVAESKGLYLAEAPEGYMNVKNIAKKLGVSDQIVSGIISEFGVGLDPIMARPSKGQATRYYAPVEITRIREIAEIRGLLTPAAPEGYKSVRRIAKELGVDPETITNIIKELSGLTPIEAKSHSLVTNAYSPEDIERIREVAESRKLSTPVAPERYMGVSKIAKELRASHVTIKDIIKELGELTPIDAKFGSRVADAYSPEDVAKIREQLRIKRENKS
ncbi:MAG: hypothetical protein WCP56_03925, partial [Candidatus Saccharibacteria bacterium]